MAASGESVYTPERLRLFATQLSDNCIDDEFSRILRICAEISHKPIIAHLERYHKFPNALLKFLQKRNPADKRLPFFAGIL
ncbi:MAG: hypothetical protein ACLR56_10610 [Oscillospiraceae bacterium]